MAQKDRALGFKYNVYRYRDGSSKMNKMPGHFQSTSGDYATAMNQLLDHIDEMWKGYDLEIEKIIVYSYLIK